MVFVTKRPHRMRKLAHERGRQLRAEAAAHRTKPFSAYCPVCCGVTRYTLSISPACEPLSCPGDGRGWPKGCIGFANMLGLLISDR